MHNFRLVHPRIVGTVWYPGARNTVDYPSEVHLTLQSIAQSRSHIAFILYCILYSAIIFAERMAVWWRAKQQKYFRVFVYVRAWERWREIKRVCVCVCVCICVCVCVYVCEKEWQRWGKKGTHMRIKQFICHHLLICNVFSYWLWPCSAIDQNSPMSLYALRFI